MLQWQALLLSWLIEIPLVVLIFRKIGVTPLRSIIAGIIATGITHPFAWFLANGLPANDYTATVLLIESLVILIEASTLKLITRTTGGISLITASVANICSFSLGNFIQ